MLHDRWSTKAELLKLSQELNQFKTIVFFDFEFSARDGEPHQVWCVYWITLSNGCATSQGLWRNQILELNAPPYPVDESTVFVAYMASAEINCHLSLGWELPKNVLDLYVENKNGQPRLANPVSYSLLHTLKQYKIPALDVETKNKLRGYFISKTSWTPGEKRVGIKYCASDVLPLPRLLAAMLPKFDINQALLRGRYMVDVATIEHRGIPVDAISYGKFLKKKSAIRSQLITEIGEPLGVYEDGIFKMKKFESFLARNHILGWPRTASGALATDIDTFKNMKKLYPYPAVQKLASLKQTLTAFSGEKQLPIGKDGRLRTMESPFGTITGRHKNTKPDIFMEPKVIRKFIKPAEGCAIASIDFSQQEYAIAAALSGDVKMQDAYASGDPYLAFGKQVGQLPENATAQTHKAERDIYKTLVLAMQYGMSAKSLGQIIRLSEIEARELIKQYKNTYSTYYSWSESYKNIALETRKVTTKFGWAHKLIAHQPGTREGTKLLTLGNFPMQAHGGEILRFSCRFLIDNKIKIIATLHDEIMIEASIENIEEQTQLAQHIMQKAASIVCGNVKLRTSSSITRYPDRYLHETKSEIWDIISTAISAA